RRGHRVDRVPDRARARARLRRTQGDGNVEPDAVRRDVVPGGRALRGRGHPRDRDCARADAVLPVPDRHDDVGVRPAGHRVDRRPVAREPGRAPACDRSRPRGRVRRGVMPNLVVKDLTMEFSSGGYKLRPIDSLDLDVSTGELVLLLGASGCGKTTLLSMLARLLTPTHGTIQFGDTDVTALTGHALAEY